VFVLDAVHEVEINRDQLGAFTVCIFYFALQLRDKLLPEEDVLVGVHVHSAIREKKHSAKRSLVYMRGEEPCL
jgi:hypothetical protein